MKYVITILVILYSSSSLAAKVSYVSVKNDKVYFSTAIAKSHTIPTCVTTENTNKWALNIAEPSGRAMYSILVTAMAANMDLSVVSANDCGAETGYERPIEITLGSADSSAPIGSAIYKSCDEILQNIPSAQDGVYTIQPTVGQFQVYCDMEWNGGWTLVMRGKEGDTSGWNTSGFLNPDIEKSPIGGTFKLADEAINLLVTQAYKVTDVGPSQVTIYFKNTCIYKHLARWGADCETSYKSLSWETPFGGYPKGYGLQNYKFVSGYQDGFFDLIANYGGVWRVGTGSTGSLFYYVDGDGVWKNGNDRGYSASFNMWVR